MPCRLVATAIHTLLTPEGRELTKVRHEAGSDAAGCHMPAMPSLHASEQAHTAATLDCKRVACKQRVGQQLRPC